MDNVHCIMYNVQSTVYICMYMYTVYFRLYCIE